MQQLERTSIEPSSFSGFRVDRRRLALVAAAGAIFGGVFGHAEPSQAFWARQDGSSCTQATTSSGDVMLSGGCNNSTAGSVVAVCPVNDTSTNPKTNITTLNLHVEDRTSSGAIIASRCVSFYNAAGFSCGSQDLSVNGVDTLRPATFSGWNTTDFGYLNVVIPPRSGVASSCVKGYYTAG